MLKVLYLHLTAHKFGVGIVEAKKKWIKKSAHGNF